MARIFPSRPDNVHPSKEGLQVVTRGISNGRAAIGNAVIGAQTEHFAGEQGGAAAGLVLSINNGKTTVERVADECLKVDHLQARCTRLRKNLGIAAKWQSTGAGIAYMLTFTYRPGVEWKPEHVKEAMRHLRQWCKRVHGWTLRYLWVMELTQRGVPHYHCIVWLPALVVKKSDLMFDRRGWWPHGMTNVVQAVAPTRYVMKYVSKFDSVHSFPKGSRCYGIGGLDAAGRGCRRWVNLPRFVQARSSVSCKWRRAAGGGWVDGNGELWPSEWGVSAIGKGYTRIMRLRSYPVPPVHPSGPFSWLPAGSGAAASFF